HETVLSLCVALAVALLARAVGVVLVVALLALPALAARSFARFLPGRMVAAGGVAFASCAAGLWASWRLDCPPSAPVVFAAAAFAAPSLFRIGRRA
ncbi:MAG: metal ABC transporter permease, partial [Kiritimatiellae bacterium]|nr:metal ABC transporter permease [Kiritimatiellia bacterium]